jgi:hypothetical protein
LTFISACKKYSIVSATKTFPSVLVGKQKLHYEVTKFGQQSKSTVIVVKKTHFPHTYEKTKL